MRVKTTQKNDTKKSKIKNSNKKIWVKIAINK